MVDLSNTVGAIFEDTHLAGKNKIHCVVRKISLTEDDVLGLKFARADFLQKVCKPIDHTTKDGKPATAGNGVFFWTMRTLGMNKKLMDDPIQPGLIVLSP